MASKETLKKHGLVLDWKVRPATSWRMVMATPGGCKMDSLTELRDTGTLDACEPGQAIVMGSRPKLTWTSSPFTPVPPHAHSANPTTDTLAAPFARLSLPSAAAAAPGVKDGMAATPPAQSLFSSFSLCSLPPQTAPATAQRPFGTAPASGTTPAPAAATPAATATATATVAPSGNISTATTTAAAPTTTPLTTTRTTPTLTITAAVDDHPHRPTAFPKPSLSSSALPPTQWRNSTGSSLGGQCLELTFSPTPTTHNNKAKKRLSSKVAGVADSKKKVHRQTPSPTAKRVGAITGVPRSATADGVVQPEASMPRRRRSRQGSVRALQTAAAEPGMGESPLDSLCDAALHMMQEGGCD